MTYEPSDDQELAVIEALKTWGVPFPTYALVGAVLSAVGPAIYDTGKRDAFNEVYGWHRSEHHREHTCPEGDWLACMVRAIREDALYEAADEIEREGPWCSGDSKADPDCRSYIHAMGLVRSMAVGE